MADAERDSLTKNEIDAIDANATSNRQPVKTIDQEFKRPLSESWREQALSASEVKKVAEILEACGSKDVAKLVALASTKGGFIEDEIRRRAWLILLGSDNFEDDSSDWKELPHHRDEDQIALDVNRAFVYYPRNETNDQISHRKEELSDLITSTLRPHPDLHYFQGYHDIAQVLLLVLGSSSAKPALARLSLLRIRDFMLPTMSATNHHLELLPPILYAADPGLCKRLSGLQPFFALAATLTMFAHEIEEYGGISRLFDFLLAREAVISVYLFAAIVMVRKDELLELGDDEPEMLYAVLSKLPKPLDMEGLIERATDLYARYPPQSLPFGAWRKVSRNSVLKTTSVPADVRTQTLRQGHEWLRRQAKEIERAEARKAFMLRTRMIARKYQRPAAGLALAAIIGAFSIWLGRNGSSSAWTDQLGPWGWLRHRLLFSIRQAFANWGHA